MGTALLEMGYVRFIKFLIVIPQCVFFETLRICFAIAFESQQMHDSYRSVNLWSKHNTHFNNLYKQTQKYSSLTLTAAATVAFHSASSKAR